MKVLYLAPPRSLPDRLSRFTFVEEEIIGLAEAGIEVFILAYPVAGSGNKQPSHPRIHIRSLLPGISAKEIFGTAKFIWDIRREIPMSHWLSPFYFFTYSRYEWFMSHVVRTERIDIIHTNFAWPGGYGGVLAKLHSGVPLVSTCRGMEVLRRHEMDYGARRKLGFERAIKFSLSKSDRTTHVSDFMRECATDLGADPEAATTIRKGVDCDRFGAAVPLHMKSSSPPMILTVCSLTSRKGVDYVIRALGLLANTHDFTFVVVGYGPEQGKLEKLTKAMSIASRTTFMGAVPREHIHKVFEDSDIFVLGSLLEASGNVILEAMASGRPVVCTDSGGPGEYISDGVSGFIVPIADPDAMAEKLSLLLGDRALRVKLGRQARDRAFEGFAYPNMIQSIIEVYESVVTGTDKIAPQQRVLG